MNKLYNLARVTTATTGTGTMTLGSAVSGYLTFANAGVSNGEVVTYGIRDGANSEIGMGTYSTAGTTLTRTTVYRSTGAAFTGKITLSGNAIVFITQSAEDLREIGIRAVSKTSNYTVLASDNMRSFNNIGAVGEVDLTLPTAVADLKFTFVVYAAQILKIIGAGADVIKGGTTFSDVDIQSNEPYSSLTLEAHGSGLWVATSTVGNWS